MSKSLEELEEQGNVVEGEIEFVPDGEAELPSTEETLIDSVDLLKKCALLLDFFSDTIVCPTITKRERAIMLSMSSKIHDFTDEADMVIEETSDF